MEVDLEYTHNWYTQANVWDCSCGHCRNFLAHAERGTLPVTVLTVLKELRIPPEKATYLSELYTDEDGVHYQFSYRIAGRILNEDDANSATAEWGEIRCCHEVYPYGAPDFPTPHFDLEFWVTLPCLL